MQNTFNILVTSLGKKVPLIRAVKKSLDNIVPGSLLIGSDVNRNCIGAFFTDLFWEMPPQNELSMEKLIDFCSANQVKAIIPTRDGELPFYAAHRSVLEKKGIFCLISTPQAIDFCRDKLLFSQHLLSHNLPAIPTSLILNNSKQRWVVKERYGAGSRSIGINLSDSEANDWAQRLSEPIFQPYVEGKEYSLDIYINRSQKVHGVIARSRDCIVDGESQITTSVSNRLLEDLGIQIAETLGLYGHAVCQILEDKKGHYHIIECNPRFGGASTLSIEMGLHSFDWFLLESLGKTLPAFQRSQHEKQQVRYAADLIYSLE